MKAAGHPCPNCNALPCAEFAQKDQAPRWRCNSCDAGGLLSGEFTGRPAPPVKVPQQKKHWRDVRGAGMNAFVYLALLLGACAPAGDQVAVDGCLLKEYLAECDSELATPEEAAACRLKAPHEATRLLAGIPAPCRAQVNL